MSVHIVGMIVFLSVFVCVCVCVCVCVVGMMDKETTTTSLGEHRTLGA